MMASSKKSHKVKQAALLNCDVLHAAPFIEAAKDSARVCRAPAISAASSESISRSNTTSRFSSIPFMRLDGGTGIASANASSPV